MNESIEGGIKIILTDETRKRVNDYLRKARENHFRHMKRRGDEGLADFDGTEWWA